MSTADTLAHTLAYVVSARDRHCPPDGSRDKWLRDVERYRFIQDREERSLAAFYREAIRGLSQRHMRYAREHDADVHSHLTGRPQRPLPDVWRKLVELWDWQESLIMVGPTGTQKTTTATWVAMHWACGGGSVEHTTAIRVSTASDRDIDTWRHCSLLILDELHRLDGQPEWKVAPVMDLIDYRYQAESTTIACGTIDPSAMGSLVGPEVTRRFGLKIQAGGTR